MRSKKSAFLLAFTVLFGIGLALIPTSRPAPVPPAEGVPHVEFVDSSLTVDTSAEIPAGHKLLYRVARNKAAEIYAKDKRISRDAAREKIASVDDAAIHAAVKAAKISVKAPIGDGLADVLQWLVDNRELIIEVAKLIIAILAIL